MYPGDFIGDLPVNAVIQPAGLPINTSMIKVLRNDVRVIPLSGEVPRRRILLARVKDSHPTGAEIAMTAMLVEAAGDLTLVSHR